MTRTIGAKDKSRRKSRIDIGKKRKKYAGKPVKGKIRKRFPTRRGRKESIIIRCFERVSMTRDGYNRWNPYLRPSLCKEVTKMHPSIQVNVSEINNKEKIEQFIAERYWNGTFVIMGVTHAKTRTHTKWVKLCKIQVKENQSGNTGRMVENKRLNRYWFWND